MAVRILIHRTPGAEQRPFRSIGIAPVANQVAEALQGKCGSAIARRHGFVGQRLGPVH